MHCATIARHVTVGAALSLIYGPGTLFIRDIAITSLVPRNALRGGIFHSPDYLFAFLVGLAFYTAFLPSFRWSIIQDAFRTTQTQWSLSLETLILLNGFYAHAVYFLTQTLLMREKNFADALWEAWLVFPSSLIMTTFADGTFVIYWIQRTLVLDFAQ